MRHIILATAALLISSTALAAEAEQFTIKHEEAALGSRMKTVRFTLNVPPEKKYQDLTEKQKSNVRANYEGLGQDDEPPYPVDGVLALYTAVSDVGVYFKAKGEVELVATVAPDGKVKAVSAYKSPDHRMTEYVTQILAVQKFKPGICKGAPCEMDFLLKLDLDRKRN